MDAVIAGENKCHICGTRTDFACSDCRIDLGAVVRVCSKKECKDQHAKKCPHELIKKLDTLEKAITEMRQRIANCHDRLLRGDSDVELLDFFRGSWGPPTGKGFWSDEQVKPLIEALRGFNYNMGPRLDTDLFPVEAGSIRKAAQALARARALGMEDKP